MSRNLFALSTSALALLLASCTAAHAVPINFAEAGTTVNGFQDDFLGTSLGSGWANYQDVNYTIGGGIISFANPSANVDPNAILYKAGVSGNTNTAYDTSTQEVLARIRVTGGSIQGGHSRAGIGAAFDPTATKPGGINWLFKFVASGSLANDPNNTAGDRVQLLNDGIAWGPEQSPTSFDWDTNTWYWLRLRQEEHANDATTANPDAYAKIWLADGTTPEPAGWQVTWNYVGQGSTAPSTTLRGGFASIIAASLLGEMTFDVDYFLLQANGLPQITVVPEPSSWLLAALAAIGLLPWRIGHQRT